MSFLDRIRACNEHDLSGYLALVVAGRRIGWVRRDRAEHLRQFPETFELSPDAVSLAKGLDTAEARTAAMAEAVAGLAAMPDGGPRLRQETYAIRQRFADAPLFTIDRGAVPWFGLRAYGVHMNGFVRRQDGLHMWVGRRAMDKSVCPGMLDNMVAGGQPAALGLRENLIKEAGEEANIPPGIAERAVSVGAISYVLEAPEGIKPDVMFCFDLELPADFVPENTDGELSDFYLWPAEKVAAIVRDTEEFKFNCNLVVIDFLIRHGLIPPDHPDFVDLVKGLRL